MGVWGEGPMDNDSALDWMANSVESPFAAAIEEALRGYLEGRRAPAEAEAAAALLVDYTLCPGAMRYRHIDLSHEAKERGLWKIGIDAVERMMADIPWLDSWIDPDAKRLVLEDLKAELLQLDQTHQNSG
ncbi:DUF4259 domain-containing protein [Tautonia plasticadhaerens]|uniref:DUF4259 domain-containing protein n=1 Tax=Tautonia plasticadhaerens TaxID=2527974 RepID=A0A518HAC2_9BACT|nr:DUF4259 domain-containing protein [Tautonia plasticadhaerens]QDV37793.1 hypothetical protein ElP_57390 [Tautonia plasticadhaerens]